MYRLLRERSQVKERRAQARRPALVKPELVASRPNEVWSWDITKLAGPYKWTWFQLYASKHHRLMPTPRLCRLVCGLKEKPLLDGPSRR